LRNAADHVLFCTREIILRFDCAAQILSADFSFDGLMPQKKISSTDLS